MPFFPTSPIAAVAALPRTKQQNQNEITRRAAGTVSAADNWDEPVKRKHVRPSMPGSVERLMHTAVEAGAWRRCRHALRAAAAFAAYAAAAST